MRQEMLGLGTGAGDLEGLKHRATDNDVPYPSRVSKPIRVPGAREHRLYHPRPCGHGFLSAKPAHGDRQSTAGCC